MPSTDYRALRGIGVVPTYDELWSEPVPELNSLLAAVPVQTWFAFLLRLITVLVRDNASAQDKTRILLEMLDDDARHRALLFLESNQNASLISAFSVLLLLELTASRAELAASPAPLIDPATRAMMVKALYVVSDRLNESLTAGIPHNPSGAAAALRERSILGQPTRRMLTAFGLWRWSHVALDDRARNIRATFDAHFASRCGVSLEQWVVGLSLATLAAVNQPLTEAITTPIFIVENRSDLTPAGRALIGACLSQLSLTTDAFRAECKRADAEKDLFRSPSLIPVKAHPCLRTVEGVTAAYRAISPLHVAEAGVRRPVLERARDSAQRNIALIEYGHLVESYVHALLMHAFGDRYQRLEPSNSRKRAEGIIWYPQGFIVIECKARSSSEWVRYQMRSDDEYAAELHDSGLAKAAQQIESTIDDVLSGSIPQQCAAPPRVAGGIIVSLQDLALSWISGSVFERLLPPTRMSDGVLRLRPQLMEIETLEEIDKWEHVDLLEVLTRKMQDKDMMFECVNAFLQHERGDPKLSRTKRIMWDALRAFIVPYLNAPEGNAIG